MRYRVLVPLVAVAALAAAASAQLLPLTLAAESAPVGALSLGPRLELKHSGKGHEIHLSGVAVAAAPDGGALLTWGAEEGQVNQLYVARIGAGESKPVRVNPDTLSIEALHHPPRLAVAQTGEVYLSWSSVKPKPEGTLFASDLRLSRSLDGGKSFSGHLRVNEDRPISHSFDGLAVAPDGTVLVSWLDSRTGGANAGTYMARVVDAGTRVDGIARVGDDTCVCCRVDAAAGPGETVTLIWRKVFPGDIRDMVLSTSRDGGRSFGAANLVSADHWRITACPHRGGTVGIDGRGRIYATWYTEGAQGRPDLYFATSDDGRTFGPRRRLHTSSTSIPDHARMAVNREGRAVIVWEDSTAVRRRIVFRYTADGGRTLSAVQTLSTAIKAWEPDIAVAPDGSFLIAWHEEQFPNVKTAVQTVRVGASGSR
jgi:hypothetical protein